jgi:3'-phosphoadenosine 5'-phosphosulfate synthase
MIHLTTQKLKHMVTSSENNGIIPRAANDRVSELMVAPEKKEEFLKEAAELPSVEINKLDLQWVQVLGEGWASPLKGINRNTLEINIHCFAKVFVP